MSVLVDDLVQVRAELKQAEQNVIDLFAQLESEKKAHHIARLDAADWKQRATKAEGYIEGWKEQNKNCFAENRALRLQNEELEAKCKALREQYGIKKWRAEMAGGYDAEGKRITVYSPIVESKCDGGAYDALPKHWRGMLDDATAVLREVPE